MNKFIVPPRLNRMQLLFGFTIWEAGALLGLIVVAIFAKVTFLATVAAFVAVLCFRSPELETGEYRPNAAQYIRLLFRYYRTYQVYSLRECAHED